MDLNQLKSFVAIAHQGNLTQAAELLHLSQPAVSAQIKAIEKRLNIILFERSAGGMKLTRSGEALLPHAESLLQQMHKLDSFAATLSDHYSWQLDIGLITPMPETKMAKIAAYIMQENPALYLNFHHGLSGDIINAVRKKELHAGFFLGENPYRNVTSIPLESIEYWLICPQKWGNNLQNAPPKTLGQYPWIHMPSASGSHHKIQQLWKEWHINPHTMATCNHAQMVLEMVAEGLGVALVPRFDVTQFQRQEALLVLHDYTQQLSLSLVYANEFEEDGSLGILKSAIEYVW